MATVAPRGLRIGTIIDKTLGVMEYSAVPALIYIAALTVITGALTYFTANMTGVMPQLGVGIAKWAIGVSAAYLLLDAMVGKTGLRTRTGEDVFFAYFGLSILYTLGVTAGFMLIIFPGLIIMARWIIAQPLLVARGEGVKQSLGESWERTKGAEFQIIVAALALLLVPIIVTIAAGTMLEKTSPVGIGLTQLASSVMSVISLSMGVAIYGLIESRKAARQF